MSVHTFWSKHILYRRRSNNNETSSGPRIHFSVREYTFFSFSFLCKYLVCFLTNTQNIHDPFMMPRINCIRFGCFLSKGRRCEYAQIPKYKTVQCEHFENVVPHILNVISLSRSTLRIRYHFNVNVFTSCTMHYVHCYFHAPGITRSRPVRFQSPSSKLFSLVTAKNIHTLSSRLLVLATLSNGREST